MNRLRLELWDRLRTNFWLVPSLCTLAALGAAIAIPWIGLRLSEADVALPPWMQTSSDNARSTLAAIGTAMIAVTGTVFSITIVTLSLASQQFGPRLLRRFMNDLPTQCTLGVFLSTGFFCLFGLRAIYGDDSRTSSADLAVALAELLAVVSAGMLILYIHHIATMIQASTIIAAVAADLDSTIEKVFPEMVGDSIEVERERDGADRELRRLAREHGEPLALGSRQEGYVQTIDGDALVEWTRERGLFLHLVVRPGDFVERRSPVAEVWPAKGERAIEREELERALCARISFGPRPTPIQDVRAAIDELVQVAVRALSAGVNDPLTAIHCIRRLGASLGRLAERAWPPALRADSEGELRIATRPFELGELIGTAFDPVRRYGRGQVGVTAEILHALEHVASRLRRPGDARAVRAQAELLERSAASFPEARDRETVRACYVRVLERLDATRSPIGSAAAAGRS